MYIYMFIRLNPFDLSIESVDREGWWIEQSVT